MKHFTLRMIANALLFFTLLPLFAGCDQSPPGGDETATSTTVSTESETEPHGTMPPDSEIPHPAPGDILITEIMTSNASTRVDSFGEHSDWIELYNASGKDLSLENCYLSDSADRLRKYRLPSITLSAGEFLLICASDRATVTESGEIHANFKISAGEGAYLSYGNTLISSLETPLDLPEDISYGLMSNGEGYMRVYFGTPSPNAQNNGVYAEVFAALSVSEIGIRINEFMMKNETTLYDEDGDYPDWVEIRNYSDNPVSLRGFALSDDFANPMKWTFPDITLEAGEYLLVLLSGKNKTYDEGSIYLHADFKLSETDNGLLLSNNKGILIDRIAMVSLPESASYGRDPKDITAFKFFTRPTPGKENSQNGFDTLEVFQKASTQKVYISEVCSVSSTSVSSLPDEDWIELYNNTDQPVNLAGWSISKSIANLRFYTFPDLTIKPHSYLVISASGTASTSTKSPDVGFKVSHTGSTLYLVDEEAVVVDAFETGLQRAGITSGRTVENDTLVRRFFTRPTKGTENNPAGSSTAYAQPASLSSSANALIADSHTVTLSTLQKNATIYYTLDGTEPDTKSEIYKRPIVLDSSASVRAIVYADGLLPSEITTQTFLIEDGHDLNVVCLTCEPDDLFGYYTGIWADGPGWTEQSPHVGANYWKDWERAVYFEYYEADGTLGISFPAGIKNHGQYSRAQDQKSVSINLKEAYGSGTSYYPFFGEDEIAVFDNLLLRTGGQDWKYTEVVDAYTTRVINGQMDLDFMRDRPVVVYVNGKYWGLYYIREKINESYAYYHHGIEEDNLDMIKANSNVQTGSNDAHKQLLQYIKTHDLSKQEYFDYVAERIDLEEWTNYWIVQTFFANTDTGNIRFYCTKDDTGKWRWILFDMDWALFRTTYTWNMIDQFLDPAGHGSGNRFSTVIAVGLMKNKEFKEYFIETYARYLNTVFKTDRMLAILDEMVEQIKSEMPRQCERWGAMSYTRWESNIERLRTIITERWEYAKGDLKETFNLSNARMAELFPEV